MTDRALLKHFLGTLAYRTQKALADAPAEFGAYRAAPGVRTPVELLEHMTDVLCFALDQMGAQSARAEASSTLSGAGESFHEALAQVGDQLSSDPPVTPEVAARLLQGPFTDAMTHAGQLALLRRLGGTPVAPENFLAAEISGENLSQDQPAPRKPFEQWRDAEGRPQN